MLKFYNPVQNGNKVSFKPTMYELMLFEEIMMDNFGEKPDIVLCGSTVIVESRFGTKDTKNAIILLQQLVKEKEHKMREQHERK